MRSIVFLMTLLLCSLASVARASAQQTCEDATDPTELIAACTAVVQSSSASSSGRAMAYANRGLAYRKKGDYQRAISDFTHTIDLLPDPATFGLRAETYRIIKDYQHAAADYDHAISLDLELLARHTDEKARDFLIPMNESHRAGRASIYLLQGNPDRAIADLDEMIGKHPKQLTAHPRGNFMPVAHVLRGMSYADKKNYGRAIADFDTALSIKPKYARAIYGRGLVKKKMGDSVGGDTDLADARRLDSGAVDRWQFLWERLQN